MARSSFNQTWNTLNPRMLFLKFGWNWHGDSGGDNFQISSMYFPFFCVYLPLEKNHMALNKFIWTNLNPIFPRMLCDFQNVAEETCIITKFLSTNYLNFACLFLKGKKFIAPTSQKKEILLIKTGNFILQMHQFVQKIQK